jgi:hypothetical protein
MSKTEEARTLPLAKAPICIPAPAAIKPKAKEEAPIRLTVGSNQWGNDKPHRLANKPEAVANINGYAATLYQNVFGPREP